MENYLDWVLLNIPFLCAIVFMIVRMIIATKRGMVKEICSVIATIVASAAVLLIALAIRKYISHDKVIFVLTIVLMVILGLFYKIIDGFLITLKLVAKLPVLKSIDKVCGIIIAIAETVLVLWVVYCMIMILDAGVLEGYVINCVRNNAIMRFLYEHNYLYVWISPISTKLKEFDIINKLAM